MAIKISFDTAHNAEIPTMILMERSGNKLGLINNIFGLNVTDNLNSAAEMEFTVYRELDGIKCSVWDKLKDFKLVWCREWDKIFEIYIETNESDSTVKNITGRSLCESELSQINLYGIEINTETDIAREEYINPTVFYNPDDESASLLHRISEKIPHYTIKHVDPTIKNIQRTFTFNDISVYDAMQDIAEEIKCIFIFDATIDNNGKIMRLISVYDLDDNCNECGYRGTIDAACPKCKSSDITYGYGTDTTVYVDKNCLGEDITCTGDTDSVKNCFKLEAGDDLMTATVTSCNPNGSGYIWRFSEDTKASMSKALRDKLKEYDEVYNSFDCFTDETIKYYNLLVRSYNLKEPVEEIQSVNDPITSYSELMEAYFNTIDFKLFLEDEWMPIPSLDNPTTLSEQIKLIQNLRDTSVGTMANLKYMSVSTADSYVLSYAKTIINRAYYKIEIIDKSSTFENNIWSGNFKITNLTDEEDTGETGIVNLKITNDFDTYVNQRIDKTIKDNADDIDGDVLLSLFRSGLDDFGYELTRYCLNSLISFQKMCQTVLDILTEMGIANDEADAYSIYESVSGKDAYAIYQDYYAKLDAITYEISMREGDIKVISNLQEVLEKKRNGIAETLNIEKFLGKELWYELCSYRREQTYSNSNFISDGLNNEELFKRAMEFWELANEEIIKASTIQYSINTSLKNLLVIKEFEPLVKYFEVGNWIKLRVDNKLYKLRLIGYTINFDSLESIDVEFSDVLQVKNGITDVESILKQSSSMTSSYEYVQHQAHNTQKNTELLDGWVNKGLDATNVMMVNNADNQSVVYDEHGILCRQWDDVFEEYSPKQVKIINKGLYFTDDYWEHVKTGVGNFIYYDPESKEYKEGYGVIADTIVSNLILSEKVGIYNKNNSIKLDSNGIVVTANGDDRTNNNLITLQKAKMVNGKTEYEKMLYMDENGNLVIDGASVNITSSALGDSIFTYVNYLRNSNFAATDGKWTVSKLNNSDYFSIGYNNEDITYIVDYSWHTNNKITNASVREISADELSGLKSSVQCLCLETQYGETIGSELIQNINIPIAGTCKFNMTVGVNNVRNIVNAKNITAYIDLKRTDIANIPEKHLGSFPLINTEDGFTYYSLDKFDIDEIGSYDLSLKLDTSKTVYAETESKLKYGDFSLSGYSIETDAQHTKAELSADGRVFWDVSHFSDISYSSEKKGYEFIYDNEIEDSVTASISQTIVFPGELGSYANYIIKITHCKESDKENILKWSVSFGGSSLEFQNADDNFNDMNLTESYKTYVSKVKSVYSGTQQTLTVRYYYNSFKKPKVYISKIEIYKVSDSEGNEIISENYVNGGDFSKNALSVNYTQDATFLKILYENVECWRSNAKFMKDGLEIVDITDSDLGGVEKPTQVLKLNCLAEQYKSSVLRSRLTISKPGFYKLRIYHGTNYPSGTAVLMSIRLRKKDSVERLSLLNEYLSPSFNVSESKEVYIDEPADYEIMLDYYHMTSVNAPIYIAKIEFFEVIHDVEVYIKDIEFSGNSDGYISSYMSRLTVQANLIEASVSQITGGTYKSTTLSLDSEKVKIAWNNVSDYVTFESGGMHIRNDKSSFSDLVTLNGEGLTIYDGSIKVKDTYGKDIFYTGSDGNTVFSGNVLIDYTDELRGKIIIDSTGLCMKNLDDFTIISMKNEEIIFYRPEEDQNYNIGNISTYYVPKNDVINNTGDSFSVLRIYGRENYDAGGVVIEGGTRSFITVNSYVDGTKKGMIYLYSDDIQFSITHNKTRYNFTLLQILNETGLLNADE